MLINAANYSFTLGGRAVITWPEHTAIEIFNSRPVMGLVRFKDSDAYHPRLIEHTLALEQDSAPIRPLEGGARRIDALQDWDLREGDLINTRALKLCGDLLHSDQVRIASGYALVFRRGASLMPQDPANAQASVVYLLDPGDPDPEHGASGRLSFSHRQLAGYTADEPPGMAPGVMIASPADMRLSTLPYTGRRPRILLIWHIA